MSLLLCDLDASPLIHGHIWSDLSSEIMAALFKIGKIGTLVNSLDIGSDNETMRRIAHSESKSLIVCAGSHFPFHIFDLPGMRRKKVVAVLWWANELGWPGLHRILLDRKACASVVVKHLRSRGHRHVMVLGTQNQIYFLTNYSAHDPTPSWQFREEWEKTGGRWTAIASEPVDETYVRIEENAFFAAFKGDDPPTAIFGLRDHEAWHAQNLLNTKRPDLAAKIEIVGLGNTPWSQAGHPPFTTVDFNFREIISEAMRQIVSADEALGQEPHPPVKVRPKLLVRR